ncbi:WD repeat-containing protein 6 [Pseudolycoriella hygida]|uniref:tRNA (34-2'-O)-methyltransferase regulator WDR6 n=1 Tax=Pseudolycoriella hygida TaxID=35572 RepID=A0A9Q0RZQ4_9DIPT|nr:WD repeat-containing protein 6 [Pseudolycoriella hygida]
MYTITDSICLKILSTDCLLVAVGNDLHYYQKVEGNTSHKVQATNLYDKIHGIHSVRRSRTEFDVIVYGGRELALIRINDQKIIPVKSVRLSDWISSIHFYDDEPNSFCCLTSHSVAVRFVIQWSLENGVYEATVDVAGKLSCSDKSTLYSSLILGTAWSSTILFGGTALGQVFIWHEIDGEAVIVHRLDGHNGVIFSINCNIDHGIMTTTSDDRSVKIWKINFTKDAAWSDCMIKPMKSLYGHTARVFQCKIIVENNEPYIISIGEDSNVCVWTDDGCLLYRRHFNCGATLWNLDYHSIIKTLFVCGSDSNVREVKLGSVLNASRFSRIKVITNEILQDHEYLAKVKIMDDGKIVALTSWNRLIYQNEFNVWTICAFDGYKSCVLEKFRRYIAIAGYQRTSVFEYDSSGSLKLVYEATDLQNMVRSFTFLNNDEYLLCDDSGHCTMIHSTSSEKFSFSLLTSKDSYVTVALKNNNFLVVGDRTGDLHLFEIEANEVHHRHRLKHVHGNLGCTVLYSENDNYVTSGHDGTLKVISLNETAKTLTITLTKKLPVLWMERVIQRNDRKKMYAGFNDKHFVLANDEFDIVDEIDCGGGHRFWDLSVNGESAKFIFIRNKQLHSANLYGYADDQKKFFEIPLLKWHMKSCNSVESFGLADGSSIIVSGGDDNVLKFHKFKETDESFVEHIVDMVQHISSIKAVTVVEVNPMERLVISAGGRAQICITNVKTDNDRISTKEITNFMLNSSDAERKKLGKSQVIDFDPETRFMSVSCTEDFHLFAGCSDGYIRQLHFDVATSDITSVNSTYYGKCLLHLHQFCHEDGKYLLTMATDGNICFWEITSNNSIDSKPFHQLRHHDSGVNSFDFMLVNKLFFIATGGDDQSTVISSFSLKRKSVGSTETKRLHYHTAQVNGVRFSSDCSSLYTVCVDQVLYAVDLRTMVPWKISTSTIADAKGLQLLQNNKILVYGSGIQLFDAK